MYAYCRNNSLNFVDPLGLLGIGDIPMNHGERIKVKIAFYDGSDEGRGTYIDRNGQVRQRASGADFLNAANDFKITASDGKEYDAFFDMSGMRDVGSYIKSWIDRLDFNGYEVTDVYIFDHAAGGGKIQMGSYEGEDNIWGEEELKIFGWQISHDPRVPKSCTFHFRQCYVAYYEDLMKNMAKWLDRPVTGVQKEVVYSQNQIELDDGPDYSFNTLWMAYPPSAGGSFKIIWDYRVGGTDQEPGTGQLTDEPQPY